MGHSCPSPFLPLSLRHVSPPWQASPEGLAADSQIVRPLGVMPCHSTSGTGIASPEITGMVSAGHVLESAVSSVWKQAAPKFIKPPPATRRSLCCSEVKKQSRGQGVFLGGGPHLGREEERMDYPRSSIPAALPSPY